MANNNKKDVLAEALQGDRSANQGTIDIYKATDGQHYIRPSQLSLDPKQFSNIPTDLTTIGSDVNLTPEFKDGRPVQGSIGGIRLYGAPNADVLNNVKNGNKDYGKIPVMLTDEALALVKNQFNDIGVNPDTVQKILYIKIKHLHIKVFSGRRGIITRVDKINPSDLKIKLEG